MKISLIIISSVLTLSVFLPFLLFIYNGTHNTSNTKKHINNLIKNNGIVYKVKDIWRKKFIGLSNDHKILTYVEFNKENQDVINLNLADIKECRIIKNYTKNKIVSLESLELELIYNASVSKKFSIPFFNIDDDLSEDFELQRIEKWHKLILESIPEQRIVKRAS